MYRKYTSYEFAELGNSKESGRGKQHNVLMLVGNGFDIDMLNRFGKGKNTSYIDFFNYLKDKIKKGEFESSNILYQKMVSSKNNGDKDWSDFERRLGEYLQEKGIDYSVLKKDLSEVQGHFSYFLDENVQQEFLRELGNKSQDGELAKQTFSKFLGDLSKKDIENCYLQKESDHYNLYNFEVLNFNYTSILDNYLYLDQKQFDPHPYNQADRNSNFYPDPKKYLAEGIRNPTQTIYSTYLMYGIDHPHGFQDIPRSLLFGISDTSHAQNEKEAIKFSKTYWSQNDKKYLGYFEDVSAFIIYGMSLGDSDRWWWKNICESILAKNSNSFDDENPAIPDLIIYYYDPDNQFTDDDIRNKFIDSAGISNRNDIEVIKDFIFIVRYKNSDENIAFSIKSSSV